MRSILAGEATPAQVAAFIVALRVKGETVAEVAGMVDAMLSAATPVSAGPDAVDLVGTGGSPFRRRHALSISTAACFVAAGAGARVCKHGNVKASGTSGSFDTLAALGVRADLDAAGVEACLDAAGVGFVFARRFHPAMRHAAPVRAELGVPTVFNVLGPLSNPARVTRMVLGVSDPALGPLMAGVLAERGSPRAMVVRGDDGLDELALTGPSTIWDVRDGEVHERRFDPASLGLTVVAEADLAGGDAERNAAIVRDVLAGAGGPRSDIIALNAAAALVVAGLATDLADGLALARRSLADGAAAAALDRVRTASAAAAESTAAAEAAEAAAAGP